MKQAVNKDLDELLRNKTNGKECSLLSMIIYKNNFK